MACYEPKGWVILFKKVIQKTTYMPFESIFSSSEFLILKTSLVLVLVSRKC